VARQLRLCVSWGNRVGTVETRVESGASLRQGALDAQFAGC
jgi:hypothetical protein